MDYSKMKISEMGEIMKKELFGKWEEEQGQGVFYNYEALKKIVIALSAIDTLQDKYYLDNGFEVVCSSLTYSKLWKTEKTRSIKEELNKRVDKYNADLKELNANGGNTLF